MNVLPDTLNFDSAISINEALGNPSSSLNAPGVYVFWWRGDTSMILNSSRRIKLKIKNSPKEHEKESDWEEISFGDDGSQPICLYVGKAKNMLKRAGQHMLLGRKGAIHDVKSHYPKKSKPNTTTCQLRYGLEHIFHKSEIKSFDELIVCNIILGHAVISSAKERFYIEDLAIGLFRPWFNIDVER